MKAVLSDDAHLLLIDFSLGCGIRVCPVIDIRVWHKGVAVGQLVTWRWAWVYKIRLLIGMIGIIPITLIGKKSDAGLLWLVCAMAGEGRMENEGYCAAACCRGLLP